MAARPYSGCERVVKGAANGWGGSPATAVVGRTPQFGGLDPSSFKIAVELFVGGLAERRQTLGKNGAKNQTIVNAS